MRTRKPTDVQFPVPDLGFQTDHFVDGLIGTTDMTEKFTETFGCTPVAGDPISLSSYLVSMARHEVDQVGQIGPALTHRLADKIELLTEELDTHLKVHLGVVRENVRLRAELSGRGWCDEHEIVAGCPGCIEVEMRRLRAALEELATVVGDNYDRCWMRVRAREALRVREETVGDAG